MKQIKILLFILLFLLASQDWGAEIHDATLKGDRFIVSLAGARCVFEKALVIFSLKSSNRRRVSTV